MDIKIVQDNSRTERNVSDNVVETIYQEVKEYETHDVSKLVGSIEINRGYEDAVNFLNKNYSNLTINTKFEPYIRFEDKEVEHILVDRFFNWNPRMGDGVGLTKSDMNNAPGTYYLLDNFANNTDIRKFNELKYLTKYTDFSGGVFRKCTNLEELDMSNILAISGNAGGYGFQSTALKTIDLPICTSLTMGGAFDSCTKLTTFNAPEAIGKLGDSFFYNCTSLVNVTIPKIQELGQYCFGKCTSLTTLNIPNVNGSIKSSTFYNCSSLTNLTIGEINEIYVSAFDGCSNLTSIDLSNCTKISGDWVFSKCSSLTNLGDTTNITSLSSRGGFNNCSSLTGILDLSNATLNSNNSQLFNGCSNLTKIKLGTVQNIGDRWNVFDAPRRPFNGCTSLVTIDIKQLNMVPFESSCLCNTPSFRNFIIRNTESIPEINNEMTSVNINCFGGSLVKVYVDDNLLETYKTTEGWEEMVNYLYPISEYVPIED